MRTAHTRRLSPLDVSRANSKFLIHKDKAHLLTVRATKDIDSGSFGFLPYGGPFWCNAAYPLDTLVRAVKRYCIIIYTSSAETTGDWKSLPLFDKLSSVFTPLSRSLNEGTHSPACRFLLFPAETACSERLTRICNGPDIAHRSDGGISTPKWYFKRSLINLRGGMLDDTVIFSFLRRLCNNLGDKKYSVIDPMHFSQFLECSSDTSHIHRHISNVSDLCDCDIVFFPLNKNFHWSLITADLTQYPAVTLLHEDPLNNYHHKKSTHFLAMVKQLLVEHWRWRTDHNRRPNRPCPETWSLQVVPSTHITQQNFSQSTRNTSASTNSRTHTKAP